MKSQNLFYMKVVSCFPARKNRLCSKTTRISVHSEFLAIMKQKYKELRKGNLVTFGINDEANVTFLCH